MSDNKPHRSWKQDGTCMPYTFKSRKHTGEWIEKGTPIVSLLDVDLVYLANKPASEKDIYNVRQQAIDELRKRAARKKAADSVNSYIEFASGRSGLLRLAATL